MAVQYLESLDSVRTAGTPVVGPAARRLAELQAMLETVMTLALGRQVAVPYSYAFDSHAFLLVAGRVLAARQHVASESRDRPFLLHLHDKPSFEVAIQQMVDGARSPRNPFVSSLYPELRWTSDEEREALPGTVDDLLLRTDAAVADRMDKLRAEFRRTDSLLPRTSDVASPSPALRDMLERVVRNADGARPPEDDSLRPAYDSLVEAIRKLRPDGFGQRSRLRRPDLSWPEDRERRPLGDIVDADELALVTEFVDTYYNKVVHGSMGQGAASYSTTPTRNRFSAEAALLSQRLALGTGRPLSGSAIGDELPVFQLLGRPGELGEDTEVGRLAVRLLEGTHAALGPLMEARARSDSPFRVSVRGLREARGERDRRKALDAHLKLVAGLLPAGVTLTAARKAEAAAGVAGAGAAQGAEAIWMLPDGVALVLACLSAAAPFAYEAGQQARARMERRSITRALGDYVRGPDAR